MSEEVYWNLMSKYVSGQLSLEETEQLLEWVGDDPDRAELLKEFQDIWDKTKNYPESFRVDTRLAWQKLRSGITDVRTKPAATGFQYKKWIVIVAVLLIIASLAFWIIRAYNPSF